MKIWPGKITLMQSLKLFWDAKQNETLCTWIYFIFFVYCILVLPYRNYGILIWGNTCKTYLDKLLKLQKWAISTISLEHYKSHAGPLFNKHNVLNVFDTFKLELGVFVYKHQANLPHKPFSNYFVEHNQIHRYPTRNAGDYSIHKAKKKKKSFQIDPYE